jgi:hypothetical protein
VTLATLPQQLAGTGATARARSARALPLLHAAVAVAVYQLYALARNAHGVASEQAWETARRHADGVVALQQALHLPPERELQQLVLGATWFVRANGAYYGTAHFLVTAAVLLVLLVRRSPLLARLGATLAVSTAAAVTVFVLHPVAPPRLMPDGERTVDTLAAVGGVWSYDHGVLERISDPFAALPSLHLGWATWCALAVWVLAAGTRRQRAWRCAAVAHPLLTLVAVLVTGNHWYVDAVAGAALVLAVAWLQAAVRRRVTGRT